MLKILKPEYRTFWEGGGSRISFVVDQQHEEGVLDAYPLPIWPSSCVECSRVAEFKG